ncbi:DUF4113 domain-containing protein, partial [Nitrosomonas sp.]|uniref:DUF4113 domain-containing protein n=1 Tax=Nitrosomonas sp. TaxID=42353 RepID=UPI00271B97DC
SSAAVLAFFNRSIATSSCSAPLAFRAMIASTKGKGYIITVSICNWNKVALWGLRKIYRSGYRYQKAGVMLSELVPRQYRQLDLFGSVSAADNQSSKLMSVMDQINARMGRGTLKLASEGFKQPWKMKQGNKSPNYTTNWDELICVTK